MNPERNQAMQDLHEKHVAAIQVAQAAHNTAIEEAGRTYAQFMDAANEAYSDAIARARGDLSMGIDHRLAVWRGEQPSVEQQKGQRMETTERDPVDMGELERKILGKQQQLPVRNAFDRGPPPKLPIRDLDPMTGRPYPTVDPHAFAKSIAATDDAA